MFGKHRDLLRRPRSRFPWGLKLIYIPKLASHLGRAKRFRDPLTLEQIEPNQWIEGEWSVLCRTNINTFSSEKDSIGWYTYSMQTELKEKKNTNTHTYTLFRLYNITCMHTILGMTTWCFVNQLKEKEVMNLRGR